MLRTGRTIAALGLFITIPLATPATPKPSPSRHASVTLSADALYSRRALRRARRVLQMRMLELREARLEAVRRAILRRLPPDFLPKGEPSTHRN